MLRALEDIDPKTKKRLLDILGKAYIYNAIKGNSTAMNIVIDRLDGVLTDKSDISLSGGPAPITVITAVPEIKKGSKNKGRFDGKDVETVVNGRKKK